MKQKLKEARAAYPDRSRTRRFYDEPKKEKAEK